MSEERRKNPRVPVLLQGPCAIRGEDGTEAEFQLTDLSESGARFSCRMPVAAMSRIHVVMRLPGDRVGRSDDVEIETVGVVVWSHDTGDGEYDTGVFFPELGEENAALLQAYVQSSSD